MRSLLSPDFQSKSTFLQFRSSWTQSDRNFAIFQSHCHFVCSFHPRGAKQLIESATCFFKIWECGALDPMQFGNPFSLLLGGHNFLFLCVFLCSVPTRNKCDLSCSSATKPSIVKSLNPRSSGNEFKIRLYNCIAISVLLKEHAFRGVDLKLKAAYCTTVCTKFKCTIELEDLTLWHI